MLPLQRQKQDINAEPTKPLINKERINMARIDKWKDGRWSGTERGKHCGSKMYMLSVYCQFKLLKYDSITLPMKGLEISSWVKSESRLFRVEVCHIWGMSSIICSSDKMHDLQVTPTSSKERLWGRACNVSLVIRRNTQSCSSGPGDEMEADTEAGKWSGSWLAVWVGGMNSPAKQNLSLVCRALWKIHVFKYKIQPPFAVLTGWYLQSLAVSGCECTDCSPARDLPALCMVKALPKEMLTLSFSIKSDHFKAEKHANMQCFHQQYYNCS